MSVHGNTGQKKYIYNRNALSEYCLCAYGPPPVRTRFHVGGKLGEMNPMYQAGTRPRYIGFISPNFLSQLFG